MVNFGICIVSSLTTHVSLLLTIPIYLSFVSIIVGCTDTPYSCSGFSSVTPPRSSYTLSQNSSNYEEETTSDDKSDDGVEWVQDAAYMQLSQYIAKDTSRMFALLGAITGMLCMAIVSVAMRRYRRLSRGRKVNVDKRHFVDTNGNSLETIREDEV